VAFHNIVISMMDEILLLHSVMSSVLEYEGLCRTSGYLKDLCFFS